MFGAFLKGWAGFGTNLVVPPLLLFLSRFDNSKEIMVIVVTVNLFLNIYMIIQGKNFNLKFIKEIWILVLFGTVFSIVGLLFLDAINESSFKILLGSMIILVTLNRIFKLKFHFKELNWKHYSITGVISGILNGMFGLGGIPVLILLGSSKMDKKVFKSTLVTYFLVMNIIYIITHGFIGSSYNTFIINNILIVFAFAVGACVFGVYLSGRVSDKIFQRVMNFVLIIFGSNLIYVGIFGKHIFTIFS
jgi:uncharacterized membrane protein YfcA